MCCGGRATLCMYIMYVHVLTLYIPAQWQHMYMFAMMYGVCAMERVTFASGTSQHIRGRQQHVRTSTNHPIKIQTQHHKIILYVQVFLQASLFADSTFEWSSGYINCALQAQTIAIATISYYTILTIPYYTSTKKIYTK